MNAPASTRGYARLVLLLSCGVLASGGCNIFTDDEPKVARLVVDGGRGHPIELVTSTDFDVVRDENGENRETIVFSADTTDITSPFDREYSLGSRRRIFLTMTSDSTAAESEAVTVQVYIDGDRRYDRTTVFGDEVIEFTYAFRN